jgi:PilZ domain
MADKLQRIFEYRTLLARADQLSADDRLRFDRLRQQLPLLVPTLDERDPYTVLSEPLPVEFAHAGARFSAGVLRNVSAGGLAIEAQQPPALGLPLQIHVHDKRSGLAYAFPGRVVSRVVRGTQGFSVEFAGAPSQTRLASASKPSGVWPSTEPAPGERKQRDSA